MEELAGTIVSGTVFNRTELHAATVTRRKATRTRSCEFTKGTQIERQPEGGGGQDAGLGHARASATCAIG